MRFTRKNILINFLHDISTFGTRWHKDVGDNRFYGNLLPKGTRYFGFRFLWYNGPIYSIGLWWGHFYYGP